MYTARVVNIPDRVLSMDEMTGLLDHAERSGLWYAEKGYSTGAIAHKLHVKGYPTSSTPYTRVDGERGSVCFVDAALDTVRAVFPKQDEYALDLETRLAEKADDSVSRYRSRLLRNGFAPGVVEVACGEYDEFPACVRVATSRVGKDPNITGEKLRGFLYRRGFTPRTIERTMSSSTILSRITHNTNNSDGDPLGVASIFQEVLDERI